MDARYTTKNIIIFMIIFTANQLINKKIGACHAHKNILQARIFAAYYTHGTGQQLKAIFEKLEQNPQILELAATAILKVETNNTGRLGISVESIFRISLLKQMLAFTYNDLSYYLADSFCYRRFSRIKRQALCFKLTILCRFD